MHNPFSNIRTTIQLTVVAVFLLATALTAALAIGLQYHFGQALARQAATDAYGLAADAIRAELLNIERTNNNVIDLLAGNPLLTENRIEEKQLRLFIGVLEKNPLYYGVYLGRADGGFFEVINLDASESARRVLRAMPSDRWLVITLEGTGSTRTRHFRYLDARLQERVSRSEPTDFDPAARPWYRSAMASDGAVATEPYLFAQLGIPGRTLSRRVNGFDGVVAIDMTLETLAGYLEKHRPATTAEIYLYDPDGQVIASSVDASTGDHALPVPDLVLSEEERAYVASLPTLRVSNESDWPPFDYAQSGQPRGYSVDVIRMIAAMTGMRLEFVNGYSWQELVALFRRGEVDLLQSVILTPGNRDWGLAGTGYASLPYALAVPDSHDSPAGLSDLAGRSLAIPAGWSIVPIVRERFPGIRIIDADSTLHALEMVLSGEADAALDNEPVMRYVASHFFLQGLRLERATDLGDGGLPDSLHILVSKDRATLRDLLDRAIAAIGPAQREYLERRWLSPDPAVAAASSGTVPSAELVRAAATPALHATLLEIPLRGSRWLAYSAPAGRMGADPLYLGILVPLDAVVQPFLDRVKLSIAITAVFLLLLLPLSWVFARPIVKPVRQLALENDKVRRREFDSVLRVKSRVRELDELSESMVNMVSAIRAYEQAQRELMDAIIRLIAQAIDDKSAYTGGHCERVPQLALMLAEAANDSELPAFRNFRFESEEARHEFRIAAWLHDCGKITTPEHIVDKGSKLETIYNRIHEVRMRFEVLWRDAEIDYLRRLQQQGEDADALATELHDRQARLQEDFAFVARCNVGGESLDDADVERLHTLATATWVRYFSDRIGLSPTEELRLPTKAEVLPATEQLLSDKPHHIVRRGRATAYPARWGIHMDIPEHLYNLGELYNLSISRGTLTREDRFKINEHMIATIKMLDGLPFPDELKRVPRYASTHHETMGGTGYPRRLTGDELSVPERLLAVADVFEALTASDRPYKKAKRISEALDILYRMVLDRHIDRDCFELFVREGIYLHYAQQFLLPEQIDEPDTGRYLRSVPG